MNTATTLHHSHTTSIPAERYLYAFITLHVLVWTLIPNWIRTGLPMDSAEGSAWGRNLTLGYERNPWLNGWLTRLAIELGGNSDIFVYFFSQLCVALAFWSVWRLGCKMLNPLQALLAVLMLAGIQYYTLAAVDFNDNILELGLWPLSILLFYQAIISQRRVDWLGFGAIAGLAVMAKYYSAILCLTMLIFLIWHPKARMSFRKPGLYLGAALFVLIILPHIIWLFYHDFVTIRYALTRVDNGIPTFWRHIQPGLMFALMQPVTFLGAVALLVCASPLQKQKKPHATTHTAIDSFNLLFLWIVGVGPFLITVCLALIAGWKLQQMWGMPLLSCWGLLLIYYLKPNITSTQFYRFAIAVLVVFTALISGYTWTMLKPGNTGSGNFPARTFAEDITAIWHAHYQTPLPYVVGDRVLSSNVARYSRDKPQARFYLTWGIGNNPWMGQQDLRRSGAILLQNMDEASDFPAHIYEAFPNIAIAKVHDVPYARPDINSKPVAILIGIIPPAQTKQSVQKIAQGS